MELTSLILLNLEDFGISRFVFALFPKSLDKIGSILFDPKNLGISSFVSIRYRKNRQIEASFRFRFDIVDITSSATHGQRGGSATPDLRNQYFILLLV